MKPNYLAQAVSISLTALTLTACGSGDDGGAIYGLQDTPSPITPTITPSDTTPEAGPTISPNFIELAKQAGLNDTNATIFAETVKNLTVDSIEYKTALEQAIKAQTASDLSKNTAPSSDPVSTKVDKANPFIKGVDVSLVPTMGSSHYIRHPGSTYERTANPSAIGGLGAVATDDPTKSNPWLTNYVLGVEAVRQLDGSVKAVAIDSTGERVVASPTANNPNNASKIGSHTGNATYAPATDAGTGKGFLPVSAGVSPYLSEYDGLIYSTQRNDGTHLLYNYSNAVISANGEITSQPTRAEKIQTLQEQNSNHSMVFDSTHIANAMLAAKNQSYHIFKADDPQDSTGYSKKDRTVSGTNFGNYTRTGLIVYNDDSRPTLDSRGNPTGYLVPSWGREENIYRLSSDSNSLRIENGVNVVAFAPQFSPINNGNIAKWNVARYGAFEAQKDGWYDNKGKKVADFGSLNNWEKATLVANNDSIRLFGKNALSYEAGAEGRQTRDNSYTAKFDHKGKLTNIAPVKLHHTQYGRLTNNIDVIAEESITDKTRVLYRALQPHGAPNTVDTYFYRGTNHTTLDEMATIKARGGTYRYFGHALTYGLGPIVPTQDPQPTGIPTAYGIPQPEAINTIGNFVEATFDAGKGKVEGHIYNFRNKNVNDNPDDFFKQNLASFSGDVFGNTVVGSATNPADPNRVGSLTASFFGQGASELGGQISSISREQGYGDPKWGAVFGATRGTTVDNFNVIEQ